MDPSYNQASQQVPQMPQRPQMPISSGAGDIVVNNGAEKKSRKGLIVLIVLLIVLAIVGVVAAVFMNTRKETVEDESKDELMVDFKESYNQFVNYVVFGKESAEDIATIGIEDKAWYYAGVKEEEKTEYLEIVEGLYNELKKTYEEYDNTIDIEILKTLFIDYMKINQLSNEEIFNFYVTNGEEATKNVILERYTSAADSSEDIKNFLVAEQKFAETYLSVLVAKNNAGCIADGVEIEGCYTMSEEEETALANSTGDLFVMLLSFNTRSLDTMDSLYDIAYGAEAAEENEEANVEEGEDE